MLRKWSSRRRGLCRSGRRCVRGRGCRRRGAAVEVAGEGQKRARGDQGEDAFGVAVLEQAVGEVVQAVASEVAVVIRFW